MGRKILILLISLLVIAGVGSAYFLISPPSQPSQGPFATFFAVHLEPGTGSGARKNWQEYYWPTLVELVELADNYGAKLTLEFTAQWAESIVENSAKFSIVKGWQQNGHEIALQHHAPEHMGWDGYTNNPAWAGRSDYEGSVENMLAWVQLLAAPDNVLTAVVGPDNDLEHEWPVGPLYRTYGVTEGPVSKPRESTHRGTQVIEIRHYNMNHPNYDPENIKNEFLNAKPDEIVGVLVHDYKHAENPSVMEDWLEFVKERKYVIRTVRDILSSYPA